MLTPRALAISMLLSEILRCWTASLTASFADIVGVLCRDAMLRRFALLIDLYSAVVLSTSLFLRNVL